MTKSVFPPLSTDIIEANLQTERIGKKILVYRSTSSTNDIAAEYARNKKNDGLVIFAEQQSAGRGRAGNFWTTGKSDSILCSVLLTQSSIKGELLSLTCAVAVAESLGKIGKHHAKIKWPNDIMLAQKKIAGILLEAKPGKRRTSYIIGIGINCHQRKDDFASELRKTATSIDIPSRSVCDRNLIAKALLSSLDHWLRTAENNSKKVIEKWQELSIQLGHRVELIFNGKNFAGNCIGIDPQKGLILHLDHGRIRFFDAAHTSIIKK